MAGVRTPLPVALLLDTFDDEYVVAMVRGALAAAKEAGVSILCVPGGRIADPDAERAARNFAFDAVTSENVSGVVAVSSVIGSAIGPVELSRWLERYRGLVTYCAGVPIAGLPSIEVDNASGIRELVLHLIRVHESRKIAFVRGPSASAEAEVRFAAFQAALAEGGVEFDANMVCEGDFSKASGVTAVRCLLDERRVPAQTLDAVVAANDYMALGVMQELWRRQIEVPDQVAVVGFDDVDSARLARPQLTTARQPIDQLGRRALAGALAVMAGKSGQSTTELSTELVLRNSCGCASTEGALAAGVAAAPSGGLGMSFVQRRQIILAELARAAAGRLGALGSGWEARLLDALMLELRDGGRSSFYRAFEQLLTKLERTRVEGSVVQDVLSALRRQALPCVGGVPAARDGLEDALHEARVLASAFSETAADRRSRVGREQQRLCEVSLRSALFQGAAKLSEAAAERFPELGVEACVVLQFETSGDPASPAKLLFGFGPGARVSSRQTVRLAELPLHSVLGRAGSVRLLLPLVVRGKAGGVAVMAVSASPDHRIEELRDFLGTLLEISEAAA
jgi:DNA-binding LacI/PurR family transcriptional regulator